MIVISDTSPLNYLAMIGEVGLLRDLFREVVNPSEVARELAAARAPQATRDLIARPPDWLAVRDASEATMRDVRRLAPRLGSGELAAISLAKELAADVVLMDERRATEFAREQMHLYVTGLLGIVEIASVRGLIDLPGVVAKLETTSCRLPHALVERLLREDATRRARDPE